MVSFDVISLFTEVPVEDSLSLLSHHFTEDILALFKLVLTSTYFCFNGQYFEQTDGVAMGSPLSPVIANFFMEDFEEGVLNQATHKPTCWYRYVDDIFAIWPSGKASLSTFLVHLNSPHKNIQFTMEIEENGRLPFLDIDVYKKTTGSLGHKVYRKPTHTNPYLHPLSHHHPAHKLSILSSLVHRAHALCDHESLSQELDFLIITFKQNGYNDRQIERAMKPSRQILVPENKPTATAFIPYTNNTYGRLSRMLAKYIKSVAIPHRKIAS